MNAPAKKTTAKKTAAKKTTAPKQPPMNVLYQVPADWSYTVDLLGPNGTGITVAPSPQVSGKFLVAVNINGGGGRESTFDTMPEALRAASKAAKALNDVAKKEAALAAAREDSLAFLGDDRATSTGD